MVGTTRVWKLPEMQNCGWHFLHDFLEMQLGLLGSYVEI